jgi:hypothetical protein
MINMWWGQISPYSTAAERVVAPHTEDAKLMEALQNAHSFS